MQQKNCFHDWKCKRSFTGGDQAGATEALTIDLMHRAGMFEQALKLAEETKKNDIELLRIDKSQIRFKSEYDL